VNFFDKTLESLSKQIDKRFTVYIGDDASVNSPKELILKWTSELNVKYFRFNENLGSTSLVKQWERCVDLTLQEQWIMILCDDDVLDYNCVASFYKNLSEISTKKCNVIRFASRYIDANGIPLAAFKDFYHPKTEKATDSFFRNFIGKSRSSLSEHIFSRISFQKNHFHDFPMAWHSDDRAWLEFSEFNIIYTINEAFVSIRVSDESITGKKDNLESKNKAKELFYRDLVFSKLSHFNTIQKRGLLLEYGIIAKEQNQLNLENCFYIAFQLARIGSVYTLAKFMRRIFKAKFK
jgi:hypothetical protein